MEWRRATEQAALGFLGYGTLSLFLSPNPLSFSLAASAGAALHAGYALLRPLPWRRYMLSSSKRACVSVTRDLRFIEVSTGSPAGMGFIRFSDLDKKTLFEKLQGKRIDPATVPFPMKTILEQGRELQIPWATLEPYLRAV